MISGICKHYLSGESRNFEGRCRVGVRYSDVTPAYAYHGYLYRLPCTAAAEFTSDFAKAEQSKAGTCSRCELPTNLELEKFKADMARAEAQLTALLPMVAALKREHHGRNYAGQGACPICGATIYLTHAGFNGAVSATCSKVGCVQFME